MTPPGTVAEVSHVPARPARSPDPTLAATTPSPASVHSRWLTAHPDALGVAVIVALTALVAWNRLTLDAWLARYDMLLQHLPFYAFLGENLRSLNIPGWNPHLFGGAPFAGDALSGWMYLPVMLFFPFLPATVAIKAVVVVQLLVAGLSTYVLARLLGLGVVAGLVAATVFEFGPLLYHSSYCCTVFAQLAPWIPLALLGVELALPAERWTDRLGPWFIAGVAISQMFAGWLGQGVMNGLLVVATYLGYRALLSSPRPGRTVATRLIVGAMTGIAILVIGVGLGAAGLLPRVAVNAATNLAGGNYDALGASDAAPWSLARLLHLVLGDANRGIAIGGAAVILAFLAPVVAGRRPGVPSFAVMTLVGWVLMLDVTPIHLLFYAIPAFREIHEHNRAGLLAPLMIGPALLSGAAVDAVASLRGRRDLLWLVDKPLLVLALVGAALASAERFIGWTSLAAAGVVTGLLVFAVSCQRTDGGRPGLDRFARAVPALILAVVFVQPTGFEIVESITGAPVAPGWSRYLGSRRGYERAVEVNLAGTDPGGAGEFLQQQVAVTGPFRYVGYGLQLSSDGRPTSPSYPDRRFGTYAQAILVNARAMPLGLYDIQGYNPQQLRRYTEFLTALNGRGQNYHFADLLPTGVASPLLNLLNVRYVLLDASLPPDRPDVVALTAGKREVFRTKHVIVYENPAALPHAWIVHDVRPTEPNQVLPLLTGGTIDPRRTALIEGPAPAVAEPADPSQESASVTRYEPEKITLAATATAPGLLVLSEVYADGWRAYVDGKRVDIVPTDHTLRGVPIPAGQHTVELRYEPPALRLGLFLSGVSTAAMLAVFAFAAWSRFGRRMPLVGVDGTVPR